MADWQALREWMYNPRSDSFRDSILDDAVMGCLEENVVQEVLGDYGIIYTSYSKKEFSKILDRALTEHGL